jgi:hypothetical protein
MNQNRNAKKNNDNLTESKRPLKAKGGLREDEKLSVQMRDPNRMPLASNSRGI